MEGNTGIRNWACLMHRARQNELLLLHMTSRSSVLLLASVMFLWVSCSLSPTTTHAAQFLITPESAKELSWGDILMDSSASGLLALEVVHRDAVNSPFNGMMRHGAATKEEVHRELEKRDQSRVFAIKKQLELKATAAAAATTAPPSLTDPVKPGISAGSGEYFVTLQVHLHACLAFSRIQECLEKKKKKPPFLSFPFLFEAASCIVDVKNEFLGDWCRWVHRRRLYLQLWTQGRMCFGFNVSLVRNATNKSDPFSIQPSPPRTPH